MWNVAKADRWSERSQKTRNRTGLIYVNIEWYILCKGVVYTIYRLFIWIFTLYRPIFKKAVSHQTNMHLYVKTHRSYSLFGFATVKDYSYSFMCKFGK